MFMVEIEGHPISINGRFTDEKLRQIRIREFSVRNWN